MYFHFILELRGETCADEQKTCFKGHCIGKKWTFLLGLCKMKHISSLP